MGDKILEAGILRVNPEIVVPQVELPNRSNGIKVFVPSDGDKESGVIDVLKQFAAAKIIGGKHMFWEHKKPPLPHNPDDGKHSIFWIDQLGNGKEIDHWTDSSWEKLLADNDFMKGADSMFDEMQTDADATGKNLRAYYLFGFPKESDILRAKNTVGNVKVGHVGLQSQYRGHIHLVEGIPDSGNGVTWLDKNALLSKESLLPMFLNTAGELAISHYSNALNSFGDKLTYVQTVDGMAVAPNGIIYDVNRTMFAFDSWSEALGSVLGLYSTILDSWLKTVAEISKNHIEFAGAQLNLLQGFLPGFTFIKPSMKDKVAGGVDPKVKWLVVPFSTAFPQSILQPGVMFNRQMPTN